MRIPPREYVHPQDQAALENLKSIPLFSQCLKAFMKMGIERFVHGLSMAQKIRLSPEQLPDIYRFLPPACEALGIHEPEFYLEMNPFPNAYTQGDTQVLITVTSGLVEMLEDDEIQAVVAHECGHIACHHVLYHTMAQLLLQFGSQVFGLLAPVSMPVQLALLHWMRRSELSCDRAAAVAVKSTRSVAETMIRLAGGPKSITANVNLDLYLKQAASYDRLLESNWDKFLQGVAVMNMDHPFLAVRAREITRWGESERFRRILNALEADNGPKCPECAKPVHSEWQFCNHCGRPLSTSDVPASLEKENEQALV